MHVTAVIYALGQPRDVDGAEGDHSDKNFGSFSPIVVEFQRNVPDEGTEKIPACFLNVELGSNFFLEECRISSSVPGQRTRAFG